MSLDANALGRYLPANLVEKVLRPGEVLSIPEKLQTVGFLSDLFGALSMHVPEHACKAAFDEARWQEFLLPREIEGSFLFADVSGFTGIAEGLAAKGRAGAEELTKVIKDLFEELLAEVEKFGGSVLKFGGDAILACFQRSAGERHVARALSAADRMQRAMRRQRKLPSGLDGSLAITIGVATGRVFAAAIGNPGDRLEYVVAGEPLRRMARAEALAARGEVMADPATALALAGKVKFGRSADSFQQVVEVPAGSTDVLRTGRSKSEVPESLGHTTREKMEALLGAVERLRVLVPGQIFERLKASPDRIDQEGEHRAVTTLFLDLEGVDALIQAAGGDLAKVAVPLHRIFTETSRIVEKHGGYISRVSPSTKGENFLIIFGAPISSEFDPRNAAACALEIRDRLASLASAEAMPIAFQMGMNTGFAYCAEVGSDLRKEYTVMGDSVNLAARFMSIATPGTIRIGDSTASKLGPTFELARLDPTQVKGRAKAVETYRLSGEIKTTRRRTRSTGLGTPGQKVHGRRRERDVFLSRLDEVDLGKGRAIVILGDTGVGKSLFLASLERPAKRRGSRFHYVASKEALAQGPMRPWIDLVLDLVEVPAQDDAAAVVAGLTAALRARFPERAGWDALIASYLGVRVPGHQALESLSARDRNQQFLHVVTTVLEETSHQAKRVLVLDDADHLDPASFSVLHYLVERVRAWRVLLILAAREGRLFEMFFELPHVDRVELEGLDVEATRLLLQEEMAVDQVDEPLVQGVHGQTGGNPLLLKEVASGLREKGDVVVDRDRRTAILTRPLEKVDVVDHVSTYFLSKLDRVGFHARQILDIATVLPNRFPAPDLGRIHRQLESSNLDIDACLAAAVEQGILVAGGASEEYGFRHPLMKEVLYEKISNETRGKLHRAAGKILEEDLYPNLEAKIDLLAHHFERSDDPRRAIQYLILAGDRAKEKFANKAAVEYYRKAVDRIREHGIETDRLIGLLDRYARVLEHDGDLAGSIRVLEENWRLARKSSAASSSKIGRLQVELGAHDQAEKRLAEARSIFTELGDDYGLGHCLHNEGQLHQARGSHKAAVLALTASFDSLRKVGDQEGMARTLLTISQALKAHGETSKAAAQLQTSLSIYEKLRSRHGLGLCHRTLGEICLDLERVGSALESFAKARENLEGIGERIEFAQLLLTIARTALLGGEPAMAREALRRWKDDLRAEAPGGEEGPALVALLEANLARREGKFEEARAALQALASNEDPISRSGILLVEGELLLEDGDLDLSRQHFKEALAVAQMHKLAEDEVRAYLGLARALLVGSRFAEAGRAIQLAMNRARAEKRKRPSLEAAIVLADFFVQIGSPERAVEQLPSAVLGARESGYLDLVPDLAAAHSRSLLEAGRPAELALAAADDAIEAERRLGWPATRIAALLARIEALTATRREASEDLRTLVSEAERFGSPRLLAPSLFAAARVSAAAGEPDRALTEATAASDLARELDCLWLLSRIQKFVVSLDPESKAAGDRATVTSRLARAAEEARSGVGGL